MPPLDSFYAFALATLLFAFMPGPALLYTAARTLAGGRRAGLFAAAGVHAGGYAHVIGAALGLSAIFAHAPLAYAALKLAGAAYLTWLGLGLLLCALRDGADPAETLARARSGAPRPKSPRRAFAESAVVEVLNPKAALFFIAFLPQFADPAAAWPVWLQLLTLGVIVNLTFSAADVIAVFFTERVVRAATAGGVGERIARALGGSALMGLGAHLALSRAP